MKYLLILMALFCNVNGDALQDTVDETAFSKNVNSSINVDEEKNTNEFLYELFSGCSPEELNIALLALRETPSLSKAVTAFKIYAINQKYDGLERFGINTTDQAIAFAKELGADLKVFVYTSYYYSGSLDFIFSTAQMEQLAQHCPNLEALHIGGTTDEGMRHLAKLPLKSASFQNCESLTAAGTHQLGLFKEVRELHANYIRAMTDADIQELVKNSPHLKNVYLSFCGQVTGKGLQDMLAGLTELESLSLFETGPMNNIGTVSSSSVKRLNLTGESSFKHDPYPIDLQSLSTLTNLEALDIMGFNSVTDEDMKSLTELKNLKRLHLFLQTQLGDVAAEHVSKIISLTDLSLMRFNNMTDEGLKDLKELPNLTSFSCRDAEKISIEGVIDFAKKPSLKRLSTPFGKWGFTYKQLQEIEKANPQLVLDY